MKTSSLILLAGALLAGCDKENRGGDPAPSSPWELPHAAYMLLAGDVASAEEYLLDDSDPGNPCTLTLLQAEFNDAGNLTFYNPIVGFDPREEMQAGLRGTRSWGTASEACAYAYDDRQRMSEVVRYINGESVTYRIAYANHGCRVPVPFAVMDKPLWLLRNVVSIDGSDGYKLRYADGTATADYPESWEGKQQLRVAFDAGYPSQSVLTVTADGAVTTTTTVYLWRAGKLLRTDETSILPNGERQQTIVEYDPELLYSPVKKSVLIDGTLASELVWEYHTDGLPGSARYIVGSGFDATYTREYSDLDAHGNWQRCTTTIDGSAQQTDRRIVYR